MRHALLLPLAFVLACSAAPETASTSSQTTSGAVIDFAKDFSVTETGDIVPATMLTVRYDLDRLPKCRFTEYGGPAWAVLAYVSFDGGAAKAIELAPRGGTSVGGSADGGTPQTSTVVETAIPVPAAKDVAFWFYASDDSGCTQWDSKYGENFHFPIQKPERPVIHFGADWQNSVDGTVGPGTVLVDYDLSRTKCHGVQYGNDAYGVTMWTSIDGQTPQAQTMTTLVDTVNFEMPQYVSLPQGDHTLAIWFESTDAFGCHEWDSNYGQNFVYSY